MATDLPIDGDGVCMACKITPPSHETLTCHTCVTPWHVQCLSSPPESYEWLCPDCAPPISASTAASAAPVAGSGGLIASIRAIEADGSLTEKEKARRRQELMGGKSLGAEKEEDDGDHEEKKKGKKDDMMKLFDDKLMCLICREILDRPVTAPCGHNFCLKCFQKWIYQEKSEKKCVKCRAHIPASMASQPRINSALVVAIRMAKTAKPASQCTSMTPYHFIGNEDRPETAFTTERAKKAGKANACSGQIFVTIAPDHFGPILAEHDPKRNKGVLVGESWEDRMECRQWGAHFPHVAGIAGQSTYGAQSVALSGGYEDDEDHGEWFLYTGSGGRDLSGNKRTNKDQSFDQKFEKSNESLRLSCKKGYPVRVVRSHKEKRSSYAPETGVRYDGIYRIEKCWRKVARQGFKVCRYLFVRCDNEPAPWTSEEQGDRPRPLPIIKELKEATDITVRKASPAWDYDEGHGWKWMTPPPQSRKHMNADNTGEGKKKARNLAPSSLKNKLLKEFSCLLCRKVMTLPLTTPCAHNFCKLCLLEAYADQSFVRERTRGGRTLRAQKVVKKCPTCPNDISDFLQNPQVNRDLMDLIESLQKKIEEENAEEQSEEESDVLENSGEDAGDTAKEKKSAENESDNVIDKQSEDNADGIELQKLKSANGDSDAQAAISEVEEADDCQSPAKNLSPGGSCKRKQTTGKKKAGKKLKSNEASNFVEVVNVDLKDVEAGSTRDAKKNARTPQKESVRCSPRNHSSRVTRQQTLR